MSVPIAARPALLVLTIDCPPSLGGIQRIIHELGHRLCARWEVTVVAPHAEAVRDYDDRAPFRIVRTRSSWERSRRGVLVEMARMAREMPADLLLAAHMNALLPLVAGARGRPLAAMAYGSELWGRRTRLVTRALGQRLRRVVAISAFTAAEAAAAGIPPERVLVTPLGADLPAAGAADRALLERLGLVSGERVLPYLLTVARLWEGHKGQDMVIRALPALLRQHPDVRYVIAGEGPLAAELSGLAERLGVAHAVHLPGAVDEGAKGALLRSCRALVMVSREIRRPPLFEGFGIVYLEAALAGRPSVAGRSGGAPDAVIHGETGLLVDPLSLSEVTDATSRLLGDPGYADELGRRACERANADFTWDHAVARIERALESVPR